MKRNGTTAEIYSWVKSILIAFTILIICQTFLFRVVEVSGHSMDSTLESGERLVVSCLPYTPKNNDIVIISRGAHYDHTIVKRVIATEGQRLKLDYANDKIYVDGKELDEPYITGTTFSDNIGDNEIPEVIPKGKIFVMGDNRGHSSDSRSTRIGLIDVDNVIGKAEFAVFPLNRFGWVS